MRPSFVQCVHCGYPHRDGMPVCPRTDLGLSRKGTLQPVHVEDAGGWGDLERKLVGGRYLVHTALGRGGMGTVFEAEQVELGRSVAIKVLSPEQAKKRNATRRFQVEARTAGAIGHPNICEVYDLGMLPDGCPYLVMERLEGITLQQKLAQQKRLVVRDALEIVCGVLSGLAAAHEKSVVHRDIKPENIFLCTEPIAEVKLVDFGVAKVYGEDEDEELHLTRTGMVMGTPYYMSAEQARGQRNLDARVDVYAAGVVLYECLAGIRPYIAPNYNALLVKIIGSDPMPLSSLRPDLPSGLEDVIKKAMSRSRRQRYQSADAFREALEAILHKLSVALPAPVRANYSNSVGQPHTERGWPVQPAAPQAAERAAASAAPRPAAGAPARASSVPPPSAPSRAKSVPPDDDSLVLLEPDDSSPWLEADPESDLDDFESLDDMPTVIMQGPPTFRRRD